MTMTPQRHNDSASAFICACFSFLLNRKCFENKPKMAVSDIYGIKVCVWSWHLKGECDKLRRK